MSAIVLLGLAGIAGAAMMALEQGTTDPLTATTGTFDPVTGIFAPDGALPADSGLAPGAGSEPGADATQGCQSAADPTTGTLNLCLQKYEPNVIQSQGWNFYRSCSPDSGNRYFSGSQYKSTTTNAPVDATYRAYQGNVAHADATEKTTNADNLYDYNSYNCFGYDWQGRFNAYSGWNDYRTARSGKETSLAAYQYGPAGAPPLGIGFYQQNTSGSSRQDNYGSYSSWYGYGNSFNSYGGNYKNQDTFAGVGTTAANANVAQYFDSGSGYWNYNGCSNYGCNSNSNNGRNTRQDTYANVNVAPVPGATTEAVNVNAAQENRTSDSCYQYSGCSTYSSRTTRVGATTPAAAGAVSRHTVSVGQENLNKAGCKSFAKVDGVDYLTFVPVPGAQGCPAGEAPDVPRAPEVDYPAPGETPGAPGGLPLPPLPPLPALPPLPPLPHI